MSIYNSVEIQIITKDTNVNDLIVFIASMSRSLVGVGTNIWSQDQRREEEFDTEDEKRVHLTKLRVITNVVVE